MIHHTYPLNDLEPHDIENGATCKCDPYVEIFENGDIGVLHNAFDGREIIERLETGEEP